MEPYVNPLGKKFNKKQSARMADLDYEAKVRSGGIQERTDDVIKRNATIRDAAKVRSAGELGKDVVGTAKKVAPVAGRLLPAAGNIAGAVLSDDIYDKVGNATVGALELTPGVGGVVAGLDAAALAGSALSGNGADYALGGIASKTMRNIDEAGGVSNGSILSNIRSALSDFTGGLLPKNTVGSNIAAANPRKFDPVSLSQPTQAQPATTTPTTSVQTATPSVAAPQTAAAAAPTTTAAERDGAYAIRRPGQGLRLANTNFDGTVQGYADRDALDEAKFGSYMAQQARIRAVQDQAQADMDARRLRADDDRARQYGYKDAEDLRVSKLRGPYDLQGEKMRQEALANSEARADRRSQAEAASADRRYAADQGLAGKRLDAAMRMIDRQDKQTDQRDKLAKEAYDRNDKFLEDAGTNTDKEGKGYRDPTRKAGLRSWIESQLPPGSDIGELEANPALRDQLVQEYNGVLNGAQRQHRSSMWQGGNENNFQTPEDFADLQPIDGWFSQAWHGGTHKNGRGGVIDMNKYSPSEQRTLRRMLGKGQ